MLSVRTCPSFDAGNFRLCQSFSLNRRRRSCRDKPRYSRAPCRTDNPAAFLASHVPTTLRHWSWLAFDPQEPERPQFWLADPPLCPKPPIPSASLLPESVLHVAAFRSGIRTAVSPAPLQHPSPGVCPQATRAGSSPAHPLKVPQGKRMTLESIVTRMCSFTCCRPPEGQSESELTASVLKNKRGQNAKKVQKNALSNGTCIRKISTPLTGGNKEGVGRVGVGGGWRVGRLGRRITLEYG